MRRVPVNVTNSPLGPTQGTNGNVVNGIVVSETTPAWAGAAPFNKVMAARLLNSQHSIDLRFIPTPPSFLIFKISSTHCFCQSAFHYAPGFPLGWQIPP